MTGINNKRGGHASGLRTGGFSLIELMIALVILAILASIAYPLYTGQVRETRRTDARTTLLQVAQEQERFYTRNQQYTETLVGGGLDWADSSSQEGYYTISLDSDGDVQSFTATAAPAGGFSDPDCAQLSITDTGTKSAQTSGGTDNTDECWGR